MDRRKLVIIFFSLIAAIAAGLVTPVTSPLYSLYDLVGTLFLNALKLVIVPLVVSSIITGVAKMGEGDNVATLGLKTFGFYFLTCFIATLVGFICVVWLAPGLRQAPLFMEGALAIPPTRSLGESLGDIALKLFPPNIFQAAAEGQMLGLIAFSLLFGIFTSKIDSHFSGTLQSFWKGVFQVMMKITHFIMQFLPVGVFALVAKVIASTGFDALKSAGWFFVTMLVAFALYALVILPLFLKFIAHVNPWRHFQAMAPALLTAFTTSSSAATLPVTMECLEKRAGVSNRIVGFTLPIGTSFHMAGTAIFECVAVIFVAQAFAIPLAPYQYLLIVLLSFIMSIGIAGIPSASLVAVVVILSMLQLPQEGLALLFVVERLLDMFRTLINVLSNTVNTVLVDSFE